jgi:uncharacterized protein YjbJ (UPF0337 family)
VKEKASEVTEKAKGMAGDAKEKVQDATEKVKEKASEVTEKAKEVTEDAKEKVNEISKDVKDIEAGKELNLDREPSKITGYAEEVIGIVKENLGYLIGNPKMEEEGKILKERGIAEVQMASQEPPKDQQDQDKQQTPANKAANPNETQTKLSEERLVDKEM